MARKPGKLLGVLFHIQAWGKAHEMVRVLAAIEKGVEAGCDSDLQTGGKWNQRSLIWI